MARKVRLDVLLAERGLAPSREAARRMIMAGEGASRGTCRQSGMRVPTMPPLEVKHGGASSAGRREARRGAGAFPGEVSVRVCADVGASTGGFTDAAASGRGRVYAIDVATGS